MYYFMPNQPLEPIAAHWAAPAQLFVGADASRPRQRGRVLPFADCPGASRLANQRMLRVAGSAIKLAYPSTADPRPRSNLKEKRNVNKRSGSSQSVA
jgi:hypothetical protein